MDDVSEIGDLEELGGIPGLRKLAPSSNVLKRLENVYSVLSCSRRILILYYLNYTSLNAGQLSELTGMAPNLLSFHLRKLAEGGIIEGERDGKYIIYHVTDMGRNLAGPMTG